VSVTANRHCAAALLSGHPTSGNGGQHVVEPAQLPTPFVQAEQGRQRDPDLHPGDRLNLGAGLGVGVRVGAGGLTLAVGTTTSGVDTPAGLGSAGLVPAGLVSAGLGSAGLVIGGGCRGVWWGGFGVFGADPAEHRGDDPRTVEVLQRAVEQALSRPTYRPARIWGSRLGCPARRISTANSSMRAIAAAASSGARP
jgi:hypothetical protein